MHTIVIWVGLGRRGDFFAGLWPIYGALLTLKHVGDMHGVLLPASRNEISNERYRRSN